MTSAAKPLSETKGWEVQCICPPEQRQPIETDDGQTVCGRCWMFVAPSKRALT